MVHLHLGGKKGEARQTKKNSGNPTAVGSGAPEPSGGAKRKLQEDFFARELVLETPQPPKKLKVILKQGLFKNQTPGIREHRVHRFFSEIENKSKLV